YNTLNEIEISIKGFRDDTKLKIENLLRIFGDNHISPIHPFFLSRKYFLDIDDSPNFMSTNSRRILTGHGLLVHNTAGGRWSLTDEGRKFLLRMMREDKAQEAQRHGL